MAFFIELGALIGGSYGVAIGFSFAVFINVVLYSLSDRIILTMTGAKVLNKGVYGEIYSFVEGLSRELKIPMPKLYVISDRQANAFALGRDIEHSSVVITQGMVLSRSESRAVLAHELAHIKNRDMLMASVVAVVTSGICYFANMVLFGESSNSEANRKSLIYAMIVVVPLRVTTLLIRSFISHEREFSADKVGAGAIGTGMPLAQALATLDASIKQFPMSPREINPVLAPLFICDPFEGSEGKWPKNFSTQPPIEERIKRLEKI